MASPLDPDTLSSTASSGVRPNHSTCGGVLPLESLKAIVADAIRAPSGDNCQPARFMWDGEILRLLNVSERGRCFYNVDELASYITFGALVEGLTISASTLSYSTELEFVGGDEEAAQIRFRRADVVRDPLSLALAERHTNRFPFKLRSIPADDIAALNTEMQGSTTVRGVWRSSFKDRATLAKMVFMADQIFWENEALHRYLFNWVDLTHAAERSSEGLTLDVLGLNALTRRIFPKLAQWSMVRSLNYFGLSRMLGSHSAQLMLRSGGVWILSVPAAERIHFFNAGRTMLRLWCRANQLGLAVQPMTGWLFTLLNYTRYGLRDIDPKHSARLEALKQLSAAFLPDSSLVPCMCVRLGYPLQTVPRSGRLNVDRLLKINP